MHSSSSTVPSSPWPTFGQENRATLKLALPLISGQLSHMLMGVSDTVMIGGVGVPPLAASTFANTLLAVPFVVGIGLLSSVSVRVSQAHGAGQPKDAKSAVIHGSWLALALGVLVVIATYIILPWLPFFGQPADVTMLTPIYLVPCAFSLVPSLLAIVWKNHADALNNPWPPFWITLGSVLLDILLNWMWIYGKGGFPAMGLAGAAYSTLVSRTLCAIALFIWLGRSLPLKKWTPDRWFIPWQNKEFQSLLKIGIPASFHQLAEVSAFVTASLMIGWLGVVPLASHQIAITCVATAYMVPLGISMATTVRVGEIVGANQRPRLHRVLLGSWMFAGCFMALSMLVCLILGEPLARCFVDDPEVIKLVAALLLVAGLFQLFDGLQVVSAAALRGVDDVKVSAWIAILAYWVISLPLGWVLGFKVGWGATGIWAALAVGLGAAAIMLMLRAWRLLAVRPVDE